MYDFSMRFEKDIRTKKSIIMSKGTKDLWNEIQIESIFGRQATMECFYDLYEDLQNNLEKFPNILDVHKQNNGKILEFYACLFPLYICEIYRYKILTYFLILNQGFSIKFFKDLLMLNLLQLIQ